MDDSAREMGATRLPGDSRDAAIGQLAAEKASAEAALRETRAKLQAVFDGVETGIFVIDPETHRIVDVNPVALEMTGAPREKMVGAVCHKFVCPAECGRCPVTDLRQTVDNSERVLLTVNGEKRAIIKTVRTVELEGRSLLLESFLDITERKRSERALEEQTTYLNALIETSPLGIAVLDAEERIQMSNPALVRIFLYSREEMQGVRFKELFVPDDLESESGYYSQECLGGTSVHFISRRRRKDGTLVDVEVFAAPLTIRDKPLGILALYQDITERRQIEAGMAERHRLATLAAEVGLALTGAEGLGQGLQQCADALVRNTEIEFAQIWTNDEKDRLLTVRASAEIQLGIGADRRRMDMARIQRIAETGVPQLDTVGGQDGLPQAGGPAFVGYPLKVRDQVLGVAAAFARQTLTEAAVQGFESVVHSIAQFVERKRSEASLRESEDRFRTGFEEAPYGMCMTGLDGRFLHANTALCEMLDYTSEELMGGAWQQITHPEDMALSRRAAVEFNQGLVTTLELEKRYIHKKGNVIWARVKISAVKSGTGRPTHFITQIEDITQRKRADEAQAFLASLVESSQDAIIGTTPDGVVVSWNRRAADLYGYSAEEMIGHTAAKVIPPDHPDELATILGKIQRRETVAGHETVRIRKDGRRVEVSLNISPVFDAAGGISGIVYLARDISERKIAEERLRASEESYRELFENASDLVYTFDPEMRITSLNRLAEQTMGYARDEAVQMNLRQLVDAERWEHIEQIIERLLEGQPAAKFEVNIRTRDGRRVTLEVNPQVIYRDGKATGIQAIARDITGRDAAEMELRQAQKLESVGRLASGIAHEINTPM